SSPIDSYTVSLLRAHRTAAVDQCTALGVELPRSAFVFLLQPDFSRRRQPELVTQKYARLARRNHLRSTMFHALRHYSATELLTSGVDFRKSPVGWGMQAGQRPCASTPSR